MLSGASKGETSQNTHHPRGQFYVNSVNFFGDQKYTHRYRYDGLYVVKKVRHSVDTCFFFHTNIPFVGVDRKRT